jgi:hypothetical protein
MERRNVRFVSAFALALALGLTLGACDGAGSTPTPGPGSVCYGTAANQAAFADAAAAMTFPVYCASALPAGWSVSGFASTPGTKLGVAYEGPGGGALKVDEGAFCTASVADCSPHDADLGPAMFGDLAGHLYRTNADTAYSIYVDPGTDHAYAITGQGMDQEEFKKMAAGFVRVG